MWNQRHRMSALVRERIKEFSLQYRSQNFTPILHKGVVKEISHNEVVRTEKWLGSRTFGSCYLAYYRGLVVAVKEFHLQPQTNERQIKQDVLYKAAVISGLGDHPGLPLLFGITTQTPPYRLITQFHGEKNKSLTKQNKQKSH